MNIWDATGKTSKSARKLPPDQKLAILIGTWPVEQGQTAWVTYSIDHSDGSREEGQVEAIWQYNQESDSFWKAEVGPFRKGDRVVYTLHGRSPGGEVTGTPSSFRAGPGLYLALLWHQHQPLYKDTSASSQKGSYLYPWVRLHAIRDYYSMAAIVAQHSGIHLTINLTPSLLWQIEDYLEHGATDRALELTLKPAENLTQAERETILGSFFDAHWHNQIFPYPRYKQLFQQRLDGQPFSTADLRDLQMWFNLAWFGQEFRDGEVHLPNGVTASVRRFVEMQQGFSQMDIESMVAEQYKILRAVLPIHRRLQESGQIEVSTTPFYHPILPLLADTSQATIDRPGSSFPQRFAHPEDAAAQVQLAIDYYQRSFGRPPKGMWPAEGAVSQSILPILAGQGLTWVATDRGVLARSGQWGYDVNNPNVLCQPYRAEELDQALSIFFRDTALSDAIGFHYYAYPDPKEAARDFVRDVKDRFIQQLSGEQDAVLPVILDGENAWGAYPQDARPFLHALYELLEETPEIETVTFGEYLLGNDARGVHPHPIETQTKVYDLYTASWIDENGSRPGVDLGTWIGEEEENQAWDMLGRVREDLARSAVNPDSSQAAFEALYIAEGSDWFWWFGDDQESGHDDIFDDLFRLHLKNVYRGLGLVPPDFLEKHIVPHKVPWTFTQPVNDIQHLDQLSFITNCPGVLTWRLDTGESHIAEVLPVGGVMAGAQHYLASLGSFPPDAQKLRFTFRCTHPGCLGNDLCCQLIEKIVTIH
ncbi:MAG TPA: glycoside hydrolase family 57 protein [Anaerolineales bacterium]